jgi:putative membrane protein
MTGAAGLMGLVFNQGWNPGGASSSHPWFFFGFLFWLLPLFAFGLLIFLAARWLTRSGGHEVYPRSTSGALRIIDERYAKGEITKEQFDQMKRDVQG